MKNMLLISCSQTKKPLKRCRAVDLYDGPYYRVIRKLRREGHYPEDTDLYILSAKYGIIHECTEIDFYDLKMSTRRAQELLESNLTTLADITSKHHYRQIMINLGRTYIESIRGYEKYIDPHSTIVICSGQIGERISRMKNWLLQLKHRQG